MQMLTLLGESWQQKTLCIPASFDEDDDFLTLWEHELEVLGAVQMEPVQ